MHASAKFDPHSPTPDLLLRAYAAGIFPMAEPDSGRVDWYSPDPRGVLPLDHFHVPKNLEREVRRSRFDILSDTVFESVMRACAHDRSTDNETWISEQLIHAYTHLHERGHAHCVEAWRDGELVGGLYGVTLGGAFFGESMFSLPHRGGTNASKVCLVHLVAWLNHRGFVLLDTQFTNPHLEQFGCIEISREAYMARLEEAIAMPVTWGDFRPLAA